MRLRDFLPLFATLMCCSPQVSPAQPTQVRVIAPAKLTNGLFNLGVSAPLGRTYRADTTTNLTAWSPLATNIVGDSVLVADTNAPQFRMRYYRGALYWTIMLPNQYAGWQTATGRDGRVVAYPTGWSTAQGRDGRTIAYPSGWSTSQGSDGRLIAFPSGWTTITGPDGRMEAFPATGCTTATGVDGRVTVHPTSGLPGTNAYLSADWASATGRNGRLVAYPSSGFSTTQGGDGDLVAFLSSGWGTASGPDGRTVAYPTADFTTGQGRDGRTIAYPASNWTTSQGADGRLVAYPGTGAAVIELDFENQQWFAFLGHLRTVLGDPDFENYVIYSFFGTGEERFIY